MAIKLDNKINHDRDDQRGDEGPGRLLKKASQARLFRQPALQVAGRRPAVPSRNAWESARQGEFPAFLRALDRRVLLQQHRAKRGRLRPNAAKQPISSIRACVNGRYRVAPAIEGGNLKPGKLPSGRIPECC